MAWPAHHIYITLIFVAAGSINTISLKWADRLEAAGRDGKVRPFVHPFFQCWYMFLGEVLCLIVYKSTYAYLKKKDDGRVNENITTKGNRDFNRFVLMIPAMCDMVGTTTVYLGLTMTYASSYQMFRGAVIIFVGVLSLIFLKARLTKMQWVGIFTIILGLAMVGASDFLTTEPGTFEQTDVIIGDVLIVTAQIVHATQFVLEEKLIVAMDIQPMQAVGYEGIFGFAVLGLIQIPCYYITVPPPFSENSRHALEDVYDAFVQISNNLLLIIAIALATISTSFYCFSGITVTKELSATTRMVFDSLRTIIIWGFGLVFFEQKFHWLQLVGFVFLLLGMALYNKITCGGLFKKCCRKKNAQGAENT